LFVCTVGDDLHWRGQITRRSPAAAVPDATTGPDHELGSHFSHLIIQELKQLTSLMKKSLLFLVLVALSAMTQNLFATPPGPTSPTPDGGTTAALLTLGVGGLFCARRFFRR
jgi:hypothetical protein